MAIAPQPQITATDFQEEKRASVIHKALTEFNQCLSRPLSIAFTCPVWRRVAIAGSQGKILGSSLLTIDFNKVEWFQLGGFHVKHSCSPLNNVLGASTEAPFFVAAAPLSKYGYLLKTAIAPERFYQKPGIVEVWI